MITVKLKKIKSLRDFAELNLPIRPFNMIARNGGKEIEFLFDTDNEAKVQAAMNILQKYFPSYVQTESKKKPKKDTLKELGLDRG